MTAGDDSFRQHFSRALGWGEAHLTFEDAVARIPARLRGKRPHGFEHSPWELLEHIRLAQRDLLEFCTNPDYVAGAWPDDYWPKGPAPPSASSWKKSVEAVAQDRKALEEFLARVPDLTAAIPHTGGKVVPEVGPSRPRPQRVSRRPARHGGKAARYAERRQTTSTGTDNDRTSSGRQAPSPQARWITRTLTSLLPFRGLSGDGEGEIRFEVSRTSPSRPLASSRAGAQGGGRGTSSKLKSDPAHASTRSPSGPWRCQPGATEIRRRITPFSPRGTRVSTATPSTRTGASHSSSAFTFEEELPLHSPHCRSSRFGGACEREQTVSVLELEQSLQREEPRFRAVRRARHEPRHFLDGFAGLARERAVAGLQREAREGPRRRRRRPRGWPCRRGPARSRGASRCRLRKT